MNDSTADSTPRPPQPGEAGFALILVVIFSVLLFTIVINLITTAQMASSTGRNDALMVSMENHLSLTLVEVEQMLKDDLEGGTGEEAAGAAGAGGANPLGGGAAGGAGGAGGEGEEEPPSDSSQDSWFEPTAYSDGDLSTYVWVEDENRKFNILALASPDKEFAEESKERLERLITGLRENTAFEISHSDATTIVTSIKEWLEGLNRDEDNRPAPKLKSEDPNDTQKTIPLHLDELLLQRGVTENIFYDLILEGPPVEALPGLESVLTIYTSYRSDPGDPEKNARNNRGGNQNNAGQSGQANDPNAPPASPEPEGQGIKININTAHRAVLRCLCTDNEISDAVIDAILKFRNEEAEEEEGAEGEEALADYAGDIEEGLEPPRKIFKTLEDLEEVPEFANISDQKSKDKFLEMLTTESDVFSIHMACVYKRNEKRRMFVMSRRSCVVVRLEGDESVRLFPIIRLERRKGRRVVVVDFPEEEAEKRELLASDMDSFSREERKWNPFYVEFYQRDPGQDQGR